MFRLILFVVFLVVPIVEIALFLKLGSYVGIGATVGLIVLTALLGAILVRWQGLDTLQKLRTSLDAGQLPVEPIVHGVLILTAGLLLVTPGFATDTVGFVLLIPGVRATIARTVWTWLQHHADVEVQSTTSTGSGRKSHTIIEGEAVEIDSKPPNETNR